MGADPPTTARCFCPPEDFFRCPDLDCPNSSASVQAREDYDEEELPDVE